MNEKHEEIKRLAILEQKIELEVHSVLKNDFRVKYRNIKNGDSTMFCIGDNTAVGVLNLEIKIKDENLCSNYVLEKIYEHINKNKIFAPLVVVEGVQIKLGDQSIYRFSVNSVDDLGFSVPVIHDFRTIDFDKY